MVADGVSPQRSPKVPGRFVFFKFKPLQYVSMDSLRTPDYNVMDEFHFTQILRASASILNISPLGAGGPKACKCDCIIFLYYSTLSIIFTFIRQAKKL